MHYLRQRQRRARGDKRRFPPDRGNGEKAFWQNPGKTARDRGIARPDPASTTGTRRTETEPGNEPRFGGDGPDDELPIILRKVRPSTD